MTKVEGPLKLPHNSNSFLCTPHTAAMIDFNFVGSIALIPDGSCSFSEKAYTAQLLGASAVIVFESQKTNHSTFDSLSDNSKYSSFVDILSTSISFESWENMSSFLFFNSTLTLRQNLENHSIFVVLNETGSVLTTEEEFENKILINRWVLYFIISLVCFLVLFKVYKK